MNTTSDTPIQVTADNFESEVIESTVPVVVDFWAPWCGPCRAIGPVLEELSSAYAGKVKVAKINVDEEAELANAFHVQSIPTLAAMKGKEVVDLQVGFGGRPALEKLFDKLSTEGLDTQAADLA